MVLFNLIFRLLSNVILVIRNGCLPKFRHLQSTVNKLLENSAETLAGKLQQKEREGGFIRGGGINKCIHALAHTHGHMHARTLVFGYGGGDDTASGCNLMTSCV